MNVDQIRQRFEELVSEGNQIVSRMAIIEAITPLLQGIPPLEIGKLFVKVDQDQQLTKWKTQCENLLKTTFGSNNNTYLENFRQANRNNKLGVLCAAKEDYEKGHLSDLKNQSLSKVSDNSLEEAECLLKSDDTKMGPGLACILAGGVLENALRKLCEKHGVNPGNDHPTVDSMLNVLKKPLGLSKARLTQFKAHKDFRNLAAHGKLNKIDHEAARRMISDVRIFLDTHLPHRCDD